MSLWSRAQSVIPGGVHSPVRAFKSVGGEPVFMEKGEGARLTDVDGKSYIDFCMSWGALILGHQHPLVREALEKALRRGWTYGTAEPYSLALAEWMTKEIPFLESVRFVCSGTEAVMSALRLARGFTKRSKIIKFDGCYHGCADSLLVKAGSGLAEAASPDSLGVPSALAAETIVCELDHEDQIDAAFRSHGNDIAAVILEPLPANNGLLPQRVEFLKHLRKKCTESGALLIFDEVISGFRVGLGGMAEKTQITPDLVTYGKVMGGGIPIGAYGGRRDIMKNLAPEGGVYQAGTLAGNPLGCVAGLTTLEIVKSEKVYARLDHLGREFEKILRPILADAKLNMVREGSIFWFADFATPPRSIAQLPANLKARYAPFFHACLENGVYFAPSGYEVGFLNAQITLEDLQTVGKAVKKALTK